MTANGLGGTTDVDGKILGKRNLGSCRGSVDTNERDLASWLGVGVIGGGRLGVAFTTTVVCRWVGVVSVVIGVERDQQCLM